MADPLYPHPSAASSDAATAWPPATDEAFKNFSRQVFAEGALDVKTKQLIAVAVAHVTQVRTASAATPKRR